MNRLLRNNKGQFSIIAALLVAVVIVGTVITTYAAIRYDSVPDQPQILSAVDETNLALKQLLGFTVGYYGSVLQVTGNTSYAQNLAKSYLQSGLENIADIKPEWGLSFNVTSLNLHIDWFLPTSSSSGQFNVTYDMSGLGFYNLTYTAQSILEVQILNSVGNEAHISVHKENGEPLTTFAMQNFKFYSYDDPEQTWNLLAPTSEPVVFTNGTYVISVPSGVAVSGYLVQVEDSRGIITEAATFSKYAAALSWSSIFPAANDSTCVVEWLQNGTIRWLGENLQLGTSAKPIPPISVKAIHLNQTINGVNQEVPFQVEDWASSYQVPLGLSSNTTVFSNRQMIVFLLNTSVSEFTLWWNGSDQATQTPLAYTNRYFLNDDPSNHVLKNGRLTLNIGIRSGGDSTVKSTFGSSSNTAKVMRINGEYAIYGADEAYVIHHGVVRDIVQQEAEWSGGAGTSNDCPNLYANMVLTLPAGTSYYTYQMILMFTDSTGHPRTISDLCPIQLSPSAGSPQIMTENGTAGNTPIVVNDTGTFTSYGSQTAHHWSQYISGQVGAGIMFTDSANQKLYAFDSMAGGATGALNVNNASKTIELAPVTSLRQVSSFTTPMDITWRGAVVTFDATTTPIYKLNAGTAMGLWILAEYPPQITVTAET